MRYAGCINPSHLFVGTQGDNVLDAVRKKRYPPKAVKLVCHAGHPYETTGVKRKRCRQCSKDQRNRSYHKKVRRLRNGTQPGKDMERMKESTIEALRALEKKWREAGDTETARADGVGLSDGEQGWHHGRSEQYDNCADELAALLTTRQEVAPVADGELPGMWSTSDFTGGDPDERSHAARTVEQNAPVAVIGPVWQLMWCGGDSIAEIAQRHGLKVGDKLYTSTGHTSDARDSHRLDWVLENAAMIETNGCGSWRVRFDWAAPVMFFAYRTSKREAIDEAMEAFRGEDSSHD